MVVGGWSFYKPVGLKLAAKSESMRLCHHFCVSLRKTTQIMGILMSYSESLKHVIHIMLILGFSALILSSCQSQSTDTKYLLSIEELNDYVPEKVLTLLDSINPEEYKDNESKALYALIKSQALDKTLVDVTNDSLISIAKNYYEDSSDKYHLMKSEYYHGLVNINAGNYDNAIKSLLKAYDLGEETKDYYWQGMAASKIADIFIKNYDGYESLAFSKIALTCLEKTGKKRYIDYALLDLATAYNNVDFSDSCIMTVNKIHRDNDNWLNYEINLLLGNAYIREDNFKQAINVLKDNVIPSGKNTENMAYLALAYLRKGEINKGKQLIDSIGEDENLLSHYVRYELSEELNNENEAYSLLKNLFDKSDDDFKKHLDSKLSVALLNYHETEQELAKLIKAKTKLQVIFIITVIILIFCIIILIILNKFQKQKIKIRDLNAAAKDLNNKIHSTDQNNSKLAKSVQSLLASQFVGLNEMCQALYETENEEKGKKQIAKMMINFINSLSGNNELIQELERLVNYHYDNIYDSFKSDFNDLKEIDYRLFLYSILGFENTTIALIFNTEIRSIYSRRDRLKIRIISSSSANKNKYIAFLYPDGLKKSITGDVGKPQNLYKPNIKFK